MSRLSQNGPVGPGARVGRYEIESFLGAGGMGQVYVARDTTLDRRVALKVLPAGCTADRVARFLQEISGAERPSG
ncbi:MAG TPA: hypothetical protein VFM36_03815 [Thermoanaerobaculia bacterium]|nr:hypothetical protein [Thermoanaerobaculia bacterium]